MTHTPDHLPECLVPDFDNARWICICNQLRACEERVLQGRPDPGISEKQAIVNHSIYQNGYEQGKSDAIAAAVQRVGSLWGFTDHHGQIGNPGLKWVDVDLVIARIESKEISHDTRPTGNA